MERRIIKIQDDLLAVPTHVATFIFKKVGYIESVEYYNTKIKEKGKGCILRKAKYGYDINDKFKGMAGCFMFFEAGKDKPSYIGKTMDIAQRFRSHICGSKFEECTKCGEKLDVFFCSDWKPLEGEEKVDFTPGQIEAIMIGYNWHKGLWNFY